MKSILYGATTFFLGWIIHLAFNRYLGVGGVGPDVLLLMVVAQGFLAGPLVAETLGFLWGLTLDTMGVSFFGLHGFLLALAGYLAGSLRRRVASERPSAQLAIGLVATLYYVSGSAIIRSLAGGGDVQLFSVPMLIGIILNVLLVVIIFAVFEWWTRVWRMTAEDI